MSTALDRKRLLQFLDAIDSLDERSERSGARVVGACRSSLPKRSLERYELSTEQLRAIYREALRRGGGKLVHRFERRIKALDCLCYQNSYTPRIAIIFFHGFDGSPYDFYYPVRRFYDVLGDRLSCLWLLPTGPERTRKTAELAVDQSVPPTPSASVWSPTIGHTDTTEFPQQESFLLQSPIRSYPAMKHIATGDTLRPQMGTRSEYENTNIRLETGIDPSGGYMWWDIPAMGLLNGNKKSIKGFVQALKQNLRTPQTFFALRSKVIDMIATAGRLWDLSLSQIFVGGFSQGAMLASDLLISVPSNLAGVILLSGAPIGRSDHKQAQRDGQMRQLALRNTAVDASYRGSHESRSAQLGCDNLNGSRFQVPIFQAHGVKDPVLPFPIGRFLRKHLMNLGFQHIHFESFPGGHDFPLEIGNKVFQWLLTTTAARASVHLQKGIPHGDNDARSERSGEIPDSRPSPSRPRNQTKTSVSHKLKRLANKLRRRSHRRMIPNEPRVQVVGACSEDTRSISFGDSDGGDLSLGNSSPRSTRRRVCDSISFLSSVGANRQVFDSTEKFDAGNTFDWNALPQRASQTVVEKFLTVNNAAGASTVVLPSLSALRDFPNPLASMLPSNVYTQQLSLYQAVEGLADPNTDWPKIYKQLISDLSTGDEDWLFADLTGVARSMKSHTRDNGTDTTPTTLCSSPESLPPTTKAPHSQLGSRFSKWEHPKAEVVLQPTPFRPLRASYETLSSWCEGSPFERVQANDEVSTHVPGSGSHSLVVPKNAFPREHTITKLKAWKDDKIYKRHSRGSSLDSRRSSRHGK